MNKLIQALQRLYFLPEQPWLGPLVGGVNCIGAGSLTPEALARSLAGEPPLQLQLVGTEGRVRAMVVSLACPGEWLLVAGLYQGLQDDWALPAPALAVSGTGYQLWFSLAQAVPLAQARAFLDGVRRQYLSEVAWDKLRLYPDSDGLGLTLVPSLDQASGKWSAFIDPTMGGMFTEEPWLEMAPNMAKQADLLAGFEPMALADFQRLLAAWPPLDAADGELAPPAAMAPPSPPVAPAGPAGASLDLGRQYSDPKSFLLAVMNDPSTEPGLRIEAAKALLPYFESGPGR